VTRPAVEFVPSGKKSALRPGLVLLRQAGGASEYLRVTHVFEKSIYAMPVWTAARAREARRPKRYRRSLIETELALGSRVLGTVRLPSEFTTHYPKGSDEDGQIKASKSDIAPLLKFFAVEANLDRSSFTAKIDTRASDLTTSPVSLRKLLLRFWYFGGLPQAVLPLQRGPAPGTTGIAVGLEAGKLDAPRQVKRRGPKARIEKDLGPNEFIVSAEDIADMVEALERCAREGVTTFKDAHISYMKTEFAKRHQIVFKKYIGKRIPEPVTYRQFCGYVKEHESLSEDLRRNVSALGDKQSSRALHSTGPGDVYEVDATGGQIFIVDSQDASRILKKTTIYIIIDRWSRYVVSIYVTLEPASWEALRVALNIAFTSRTRRFANLGGTIDDKRWPPGVVPVHFCLDRGSEMISEAMLRASVEGLLVEPLVLPPLTPDGKAIVERVIKTLKGKVRSIGTPGVHSKVVFGPKSKNDHKKARLAAVHTLKSLYRLLVEIVDQYNHATHKGLKKRADLRNAGVPPIPVEAYEWGLKNLTGIQRSAMTDEDVSRILLGTDRATLVNRTIRYRNQRYMPANAAAIRIARKSNSVGKAIPIRVDRSDPTELYSHTSELDWPKWEIDQTGREWLRNTTLEEEDGLREEHGMVDARAAHSTQVSAVAQPSPSRRRSKPATSAAKIPDSDAEVRRRSQEESRSLNRSLSGKSPGTSKPQRGEMSPVEKTAAQLEAEEQQAVIDRNRKKRGK
jgi:putative transposase